MFVPAFPRVGGQVTETSDSLTGLFFSNDICAARAMRIAWTPSLAVTAVVLLCFTQSMNPTAWAVYDSHRRVINKEYGLGVL